MIEINKKAAGKGKTGTLTFRNDEVFAALSHN